jgi:hypothetical protein
VSRQSSRLAAACLIAVCVGAIPTRGTGQVTTDRGASILIFPRISADDAADTIVQVMNLSDNRIAASCAYVVGASSTWQALSFSVPLGPQRSLYWSAARGRSDTLGEDTIDIPAAPQGFRGELLCVQVDGAGDPFSGNELAGQATLTALSSGDTAAYAAAGLRGSGLNDGDGFLCLGNEPTDNCFFGEYDACPAEWLVSLPADGATDPQLGEGSALSTRVAVAPCSQNLRDGEPGSVDIDLTVFNELAQRFSGQTSVSCWADLALADLGGPIFTRGMLGTDHAQARFAPAAASGGFILSVQTQRAAGDASAPASSVAMTPQRRGATTTPDLIVLP